MSPEAVVARTHGDSLRFNRSIESLRGLAALAVVVAHSQAIFQFDRIANRATMPFLDQPAAGKILTVITTLFSPAAAVVLFFVISGYVLSLSFLRDEKPVVRQLPAYLVRRGFRLLPPMWASIVLFVVVTNAVQIDGIDERFTGWFKAVYSSAPSWGDALASMGLTTFSGNPVIWTMYVEVIGSLCIPAIVAAGFRGGWRALALIAGGLLAVSIWFYPAMTTTYLICFSVGALLAIYPVVPKRPLTMMLCGVLLFALERRVFPGVTGVLTNTIGAALIVAGVIGPPTKATQVLERPAFRFLGRISYSVYLFQLPVIYLMAVATAPLWSTSPILAQTIAVVGAVAFTVALAALMYQAVERPSIRLGRRLTSSSEPAAASPRAKPQHL